MDRPLFTIDKSLPERHRSASSEVICQNGITLCVETLNLLKSIFLEVQKGSPERRAAYEASHPGKTLRFSEPKQFFAYLNRSYRKWHYEKNNSSLAGTRKSSL
jgi:hypothetical protein